MRRFLPIAVLLLTSCVSQPLPEGFKDPDDFDPLAAAKTRISLGLTYLKNGNYTQAKFNLDKALQFAPRLADAHYSMAYYFQVVGENSLAEEAYQDALDLEPKNPDIANTYGAFLCQNGKYEKAKEYFLKAVNSENYISTAETFENLALCSHSQGRVEDAITYLKSAINHQPSRAKSLLLLSSLYMQTGQWTEAKQTLRRYEKMARVNAETLWMAVKIEKALGNDQQAQGYGDMLVAMYPEHPNTLAYLKAHRNVDVVAKPQLVERPPAQPVVVVEDSGPATTEPAPESSAAPPVDQPAVTQTDTPPAPQPQSLPVEEPTGQAAEDQAVATEPEVAVVVPQPAAPEPKVTEDAVPQAEIQAAEPESSDSELQTPEAANEPVVTEPEPELSGQEQLDMVPEIEPEQTDFPVDPAPQAESEVVTEEQSDGDTVPLIEGEPVYHIVAAGENLYRISLQYNIKMKRLIEWNELSDASAIHQGMRLLLVDPQTIE